MSEFDEEAPYEVPMQRIHTSSISSMSSLLLQGYTMLADSCDTCGVPLMRKPNSNEVLCVNCGQTSSGPATANGNGIKGHDLATSSEEEEDIEPAPQSLRERISAPAVRGETVTSTSEDPSQALADKMLEGWALLADHCPRCTTALVQNKEGRIYCVTCEMYAMYESTAAREGPAQPHPATALPPSTSTPSTHTSREESVPGQSQLAEGVADNVLSAAKAISQRMNNSAQSLGQKSPQEVMELLDEIRACAAALGELKAALE